MTGGVLALLYPLHEGLPHFLHSHTHCLQALHRSLLLYSVGFLLIDFKSERQGERNIGVLFHSLMHSFSHVPGPETEPETLVPRDSALTH